MKDLRHEVRAAFEKELAAHPPTAGMRRSLVEAVTARPHREVRVQWVAVAAAIVIGALIVVSLVSSRAALRTQVPAHPSPRPNVATGEDYGPPPPGVPLIYLRDPYNQGWYTAFDWSGRPRGTIKVGQASGVDVTLIQASDGSLFELSPSGKGMGSQLLDRLGNPISGTAGMWADDNLHTCSVAFDPQAITWTLVTSGPNQPAHNVTLIARDSYVGQTGISLASCSFKRDVAIAVRTSVMWPSEMWVIQLSDGRIVNHKAISNGEQLASLVASADGSLVAENSMMSEGKLNAGNQTTVIRRVSDGSTVATLDGLLGVIGFSADNSLALAISPPGQAMHLDVIDLATGKTIWRYDTDKQYVQFFAQPGGSALAIVLTGNFARNFPATVLIVYPDGRSIELPGGYLRP